MTEKKSSGQKNGAQGEPIIIKKYANRRLYNTSTSSYVTLDYLAEMVKSGEDFVVYDAKSSDDITHSVLTQIIFEEESKGQNLLPIQFLRQLIKFYGDSLQTFVPSYLEMTMDAFTNNKEDMRERMQGTFNAAPSYTLFEESVRQNMAMYQQAMNMFSPMAGASTTGVQSSGNPSKPKTTTAAQPNIETLKAQLAALQNQLDKLEK